jgi:gas vesicle protein
MPETSNPSHPSRSSKGSSAPAEDPKPEITGAKSSPPAPEASDLRSHYERYVNAVGQAHQEAAKKYVELVSRLAERLHNMQQDAIKSDPSMSFAVDILQAYKTQDIKAVGDAHRMLASSLQNTVSTVSKRVGDALKAAHDEYAALCDETRKSVQDCAEDYSKSVIAIAGGGSPTDLDRASAAILGYGLLVRAATMPQTSSSQAP